MREKRAWVLDQVKIIEKKNDKVLFEGDIQNCNNYRSIELLNHTMNVWERLVEIRMRKGVSISNNQFYSCRRDQLQKPLILQGDRWSSKEMAVRLINH